MKSESLGRTCKRITCQASNHPMAETLLCAIVGVSGKMVEPAHNHLKVHLNVLGEEAFQTTDPSDKSSHRHMPSREVAK